MTQVLCFVALPLLLCSCHSAAPAAPQAASSGAPGPAPSAKASPTEATLGSRSPAELIELYVFHPDCGFRIFADPSAYHAALSQNEAITGELARRGEAATHTCRQHLRDLRNIFTGDGGPPRNVASVCHGLLAKLGHAVEEKVQFQFCGR